MTTSDREHNEPKAEQEDTSWRHPPRYLVVPPEMEASLAPLDERPLKPCKEEAEAFPSAETADQSSGPSSDGGSGGGTGLE